MKKGKRVLALLVVLAFILSCLSMGASAAESWETVAKQPFQDIQAITDEELAAFKKVFQAEMERLVNEERKKAGVPEFCGAYKYDGGKLKAVGDVRVVELIDSYGHDRPDGRSWETMFFEVGLTADWKGENIAFSEELLEYNNGYSIEGFAKLHARKLANNWMNSPGHRANILDKRYNDSYTGVAVEIYDLTGNTSPFIKFRCYAAQEFYQYPQSMIPDKKPEPEPEPEPDPYPGTPFTDINSHWGRESIKWAYEQKLFSGVTETKFDPNQTMSRGMLATVLHRLAGEPVASETRTFSDVRSDAYYADAVAWASETDVVWGVGAGTYLPNQNIRREQLSVMLYRYASLSGTPYATGDLSQFTDVNEISDYAQEAMRWAVGEGTITGKSGGKLDPRGFATRAEVAAILQRFAE